MRRNSLLLGLDIGTTELKAAVIQAGSGRIVARSVRRMAVRSRPDGTREADPAALRAGLGHVARRLRGEIGADWRRVSGVGLSAQGGSAMLAGRGDGRPLTPLQLWNDTRPLGRLVEIAGRRPAGYWTRLSGVPRPGAGLARIEWLRERHPRLFALLPREALYAGAGEFAFFHLTGSWRQDAGNAIQIGCYSVGARALVADPLEAVGVSADSVAPLRQGHPLAALSAAGARRLGLPAGLPVAGPYMDHEAGYLSVAGADSPARTLFCSLGTAWVGSWVRPEPPPLDDPGLNLSLPDPVGDGVLVLRVMRSGNLAWDWAVERLVGGSRNRALRRANEICAQTPLPHDGLLAVPEWTRPNPLRPDLCGNGSFLGLGPHTTRADLVRAVAAGLAFEFAALFAGRPVDADRVALGGGASRGPGFQRLLSALFDPLPAGLVPDAGFAGTRGCLHPLAPGRPPIRLERIARPGPREAARIRAQFEDYANTRRNAP